jgi:type III restriction enzyme
MARGLEEMDEIICYAKNQNLGFAIPYTIDAEEKNYYPTSWCGCSTAKNPST